MRSTSTPQTRLNQAVIGRALKAAARDAASGRAELQSGRYRPAPAKKPQDGLSDAILTRQISSPPQLVAYCAPTATNSALPPKKIPSVVSRLRNTSPAPIRPGAKAV